jgi:histidyl-tRNA synthetase
MRDFLPEDVRRRQYVIGVIADVYQRYGFEPLETPAVENIETLLGKYGEEGDKLIFKILKRGEGEDTGQADLALRYDLTVPLARVIAEYRGKLPKFFKRYQIQPVWRADRPQKGRFREFYQCDVDAMGSMSPAVDAELCAAVSDVLLKLGFKDFEIIINHREVLATILNESGVPPAKHGEALIGFDKADKIGMDGVARELETRGFDTSTRANLVRAMGSPYPGNRTEPGFVNLREIVRLTKSTSAGPHMRIEPSLARGLSYYTGAIFEIKVPDLAGSLGGGGRYDNLVGMFSGEQVPVSGFSLGLERILVVMGERGMFPPSLAATPADVMILQWFADRTDMYLKFAAELRAAGLRVELYPEAPDQDGKKVFDKQIKYAISRGIPFVAIIGETELAKGVVNVKNMNARTERLVARAEVAKELLAELPKP